MRRPPRAPRFPILMAWALLAIGAPTAAQGPAAISSGLRCSEQSSWGSEAVYWCKGVERWRLDHVLRPLMVNVTCPKGVKFSLFTASSTEKLAEEDSKVHWCGYRNLLRRESCLTALSPYEDTYVSFPTFEGCKLSTSDNVSWSTIFLASVGLGLFLFSDTLSQSPTFRLTSGTTIIILTSVLILVFMIMRSAPQSRRIFALVAVLGAGSFAALEMLWAYGAPTLFSLASNKFVTAYFVVSGLVGLAVTYYFDDPGNVKLTRIMQVGLQLIGLVSIYCSLLQRQLGIAAVTALVAWEYFVAPFASWVRRERPVWLPHWLRARRPAGHGPRPSKHKLNGMAGREAGAVTPRQEETATRRKAANVVVFEKSSGGEYFGASSSTAFVELQNWREQGVAKPLPAAKVIKAKAGRMSLPAAQPGPWPGKEGDDDDDVNPIVRSGKIFNPESGRAIQIGKKRYQELVEEGYTPNLKDGVLVRPSERVV